CLHRCSSPIMALSFFTDTATTVFYTLSLHDALPISRLLDAAHDRFGGDRRPPDRVLPRGQAAADPLDPRRRPARRHLAAPPAARSEEHTSELQSPYDLVCRLLLEKKKRQRQVQVLRV